MWYHPEQQGRNQYGPPQILPSTHIQGVAPEIFNSKVENMPSDMKRLEDNKRVETRPPQRMISDKPAYQPNENGTGTQTKGGHRTIAETGTVA